MTPSEKLNKELELKTTKSLQLYGPFLNHDIDEEFPGSGCEDYTNEVLLKGVRLVNEQWLLDLVDRHIKLEATIAHIQQEMDGEIWEADMLPAIAKAIGESGYPVSSDGGQKTPLWGNDEKDTDYCRCDSKSKHYSEWIIHEDGTETQPKDCGCAFGQCAKGLIL